MAVGYQIFAITSFPTEDRVATQDQLTLALNDENEREVSSTSLELRTPNVNGYRQFDAAHDFLVHLKYPGRAQGKHFREFVTPYKFPVYVGGASLDLEFTPFLVRTKKQVAQDFVNRLNDRVTGFSAKPIRVSFAALRPKLQDIRGAWFGGMREPNIARTAVFGPNVDRSDEFQHAESVGELTNIMVPLSWDGVTHMLMFAAEGGIVLYNAYQEANEEVTVINQALSGILGGCMTVLE